MKKWIFLIILATVVYFVLIFVSSPYRELRPYIFFGANLPERFGMKTKIINGRKTVLISTDDIEKSFYIDQIPVTIDDYRECTKSGKCEFQHYRYNYAKFWDSNKYGTLPVAFVNWSDARNYCIQYGGDLPTSIQWESAAASNLKTDYPWGNSLPNLSTANIDGYYQMLIPAGWLPEGASPYGILDMTGNIREWMLDEVFPDSDDKMLKGGGNNDSFSDGKIEAYFWHTPDSSGFNRGFRCVYPNN